MKAILASKTVWLNLISFVLLLISLPEFISLLPTAALFWIALINVVLNTALRVFFTGQPLTAGAAKRSA